MTDSSPTEISGWVYLSSDPDAELPVEIVADGVVVGGLTAGDFRQDLLAAGKGNGRHGFAFALDQPHSSTPLLARVAGQPWFIQMGGAAYIRTYAFMRHTYEYGAPNFETAFSETPQPDLKEEIPLIERLLTAYHRAKETEAADRPEDLWSALERSIFPDFIELLQRKDAQALAGYMRELFARSISHGTYQGPIATAGLMHSGPAAIVAGFISDALASMAAAIGVLRVENPEQGRYGENLFLSPDATLDRIANALNINPVPPGVAGRKFGLKTKRGLVTHTDMRALYAAWRIRETANPMGRGASICEIGGGLGSAAFYSCLLGANDYTIVDIPAVSFMQGYWLARALPDVPLRLYGESGSGSDGISLMPPSWFGSRKADIVFNQDSFPEMHRSHSLSYLEKAKTVAPLFLSINQEGENPQTAATNQPVVADLVAETGGYQRLYRFHNWLRPGYVEELYRAPPVQKQWSVVRAFKWMLGR